MCRITRRRQLNGWVRLRSEHVGLRWIGLTPWLALLVGSAPIARAVGPRTAGLPYATATGLVSLLAKLHHASQTLDK